MSFKTSQDNMPGAERSTLASLHTVEAIGLLYQAPQEFYLTGSRFFGSDRLDSDWDFFAEDTPDVLDYLERNGFQDKSKAPFAPHLAYPGDPSIVKVMCRGNVDVQLVRDAELKSMAQSLLRGLPRDFYDMFLNSRGTSARNYWVWAFQVAGGYV